MQEENRTKGLSEVAIVCARCRRTLKRIQIWGVAKAPIYGLCPECKERVLPTPRRRARSSSAPSSN